MLDDSEILELDNLLYDRDVEQSREFLLNFTKNTFTKFQVEPFNEKYYALLDAFAKGYIKNLMVTMPPQHGKSEGSTRRLPAYMLGINPDLKIGIASYNDTFASKFNRDIQRIIESPIYSDIFPYTSLNKRNVSTLNRWIKNAHEFEVINHLGGLKSVGRGGPLTGNPIDIMVMDDLYKDYMEGNSPIVRESVWDWYTTVVTTRLHNDSQQLIVFTRWHEDDLIGRLEKMGKVKEINDLEEINSIDLKHDEWFKVNFEALKESEPTPIDPREKGEALWASKHSVEKLLSSKEQSIEKFQCLYQGDPGSAEGMLYSKFKTYKDLPELKMVKNYTDTADTGTDKLCSIVYGIPLASSDKHLYVTDVLYTDEPMEVTEPATINLLNFNKVDVAKVESNNGGRGFARVVEKGVKTHIMWFHQGSNKEARIFSNSATVNKTLVFPSDWFIRWPEFYNDVTKYKKLFKANKFDDAPDVMTGIIEEEVKPEFIVC